MAHARGANEEDGASDLGNSRLGNVRGPHGSEDEASRSILVSYFPEGVNRDKLEIHFMRASNGGGEIESITMVTDTEAKITYLDGTAVESVLKRPQVLNGVEVKVQKWIPPEDDTKRVSATAEQASRSILVSNIPEGVNKDKLQIHFMKTSNGGADIESITMVTDTVAVITYLDSAAVKTVLEKQHVLNGMQVTVQEEDDPEVFDEVHATVDARLAHLISQDQIDKVKKETGITWEKGVVDRVIEVKGTYTQVADAQQLLQQYLEQYSKQALESTNESTTTAYKESKATNDRGQTPNEHPKETAKRNFTVTGLDDESPGDMNMDPQSTRIKPSDESDDHLNLNTVSKDRRGCRKGQQADGGMSSEDTPATTASHQDASRYLQSDKEVEEEEDKKGASPQEKNTGPVATGPVATATDHVAGRKQEERDPQQPGKQVEDDTRSPPAHEGAFLTSDDKQKEERLKMASGTSNEEGSSRGSAEKDEDMEDSTAEEEPEKMETENAPISVHSNSPPQPLDDEDEPMPSDDEDPQTQTINSSPSEEPRKDVPANPPDAAANNNARREEDERHQQPGEQVEDPSKSSSAYGGASSTSDDKQKENKLKMASGSSNGEGVPRGSAEKDEDIYQTSTAEEKMETEGAPVHAKSAPRPVPGNDNSMLTDNDDPQTQTSSNSRPPEKPGNNVPANPPDDTTNNDAHVPGDQTITRGFQAESADTIEGDEDSLGRTHNHGASPDDSTTIETGSQRDESPANNDAEATQSKSSEKQKKAFYKENLGKNSMQVDHLSSGATGTTGNIPASKRHKADSDDCNAGSTGSDQEKNSRFEVFVDPDILTYIRHKHHTEIADIGKRYKSVFHTSTDNTKAYFVPSPSLGRHPEPDKAIDEFTTIYQQVFHKITCESLNVVQYKLAPKCLLEGVRKVRQLHPEVLTKATDDDTTVMFMGEPDKIRAARADFCGIMGIPASRGSRRIGNNPAKSNSAGKQESTPLGAQGGVTRPTSFYCSELPQGVELIVACGDITSLEVDAIINASDSKLQHGGGVAKAIVQAGGSVIQEESTEKMKKRSPLQPTETEITGAGKLPCRHVIHAHGPKWREDQAKECSFMLKQTCINILQAAEGLQAESVAIPAISAGKYGMPKHICAQSLMFGVMEYLINRHNPSCCLRKIWFIDTAVDTVQVLAEVFAREISLLLSGSSSDKQENAKAVQARGPMTPSGSSSSQSMSYAKVAASGTGTGVKHKNDSIQMAALITQSKGSGMGYGRMWKDLATGGMASGWDAPEKEKVKTSQSGKDKDANCPICLSDVTNPKSLPCKEKGCKAVFCQDCMDEALRNKSCCPVCNAVVGKLTGNQPKGTMNHSTASTIHLRGYPKCGTIMIEYSFRSGMQGPEHPNPGKPFTGTRRTAYLPDNSEGREVLQLLQKAFKQKLTFTIGTSATTGQSDTVVWNDIHHKTSTVGQYGYPDNGYLKRVKEELAAKGIK